MRRAQEELRETTLPSSIPTTRNPTNRIAGRLCRLNSLTTLRTV
jgi:hypothetical protein